ncbi:MAG TPA: amidase [Thermoanaerobaculia bacterium]|nr:amidase [Thermoanaerobaculia bacterium]
MRDDAGRIRSELPPTMSEVGFWSASRVAKAIARRELSSREHLEHLLERIERLDGPLGLVVTVDAERARREADAADDAVRRGEELGPLHGVCMTVKDSLMTAGMRTTCGAPRYADFVPEVDSAPVGRLRAAGAIVLGKTNLPIWANDAQSYNEVFGTSSNPWDPTRTVGGSSGGSAGALAAGFTPLEVGSDIAGSIRGPASTCGVAGHKPTYGVVSARGQIPGPPGTLTQADLAVVGPMARTVHDLELGLEVLAGPDDWNRIAYRLELPPPRHDRLADYRVALWIDEETAPIDPEVRRLLVAASEALADAGATVDERARPDFTFEYATRVFQQLLAAALAGGYSRDEIERMAASGEPGDGLVPGAYALRHRDWLSANERRLQMRRKWRDLFDRATGRGWDAVLMPCLPVPAFPHDHSEPQGERRITVGGEERPYLDLLLWAGVTGVSWLPATVVPVGLTSQGLPVGIQIAGPFLEDRTTLDLARRVEEILGGFNTPPGFA